MAQRCEVCERFRPSGDLQPERELISFAVGARSVLLCRAHARIAQNSEVSTLEELRELYGESAGQRSFISRRGSASGGAKARAPGRRATDHA
jgi:hypothetical protein